MDWVNARATSDMVEFAHVDSMTVNGTTGFEAGRV
jgi:hypothetical protein